MGRRYRSGCCGTQWGWGGCGVRVIRGTTGMGNVGLGRMRGQRLAWHHRDGECGARVAVGHSGMALGWCKDGDPCPLLQAGSAGMWCWVPMQGHLAGSWRAARARRRWPTTQLSGLPAQPLPTPPALAAPAARTDPSPGTHLVPGWVQTPIPLQPVGAAGLKSPEVTGEGAAGSVAGAWAGKNRQRWLTVGVGRQRGCWCWGCATLFPWCLRPPSCPITLLGP